ncbi:hypothetical protein D3C72_1071770 [compost metagenome]
MLDRSQIARLFSFRGRTTRPAFRRVMIALLATALILWLATMILWLAPAIQMFPLIVPLLLWLYAAACARRLHDLGESAGLVALPLSCLAIVWAGVFTFAIAALFGAVLGMGQIAMDALEWAMHAAPFLNLLLLVVFAVWLGQRPGSPHDNQYGPASAV